MTDNDDDKILRISWEEYREMDDENFKRIQEDAIESGKTMEIDIFNMDSPSDEEDDT